MTNKSVYGLVLAGGQSRRMGQDKALLVNKGRSQLAHVVDVLESCLETVYVSARNEHSRDEERSRYQLIFDRYENLGPLAGIISAMDEHPDVDWLVVACDLPNINVETIDFLLSSRSDGHDFTAYTSSHDGLPEPLCAIYHQGSTDILRAYVDDGVLCPRKILIRSNTELLQQPCPEALDNINTPDDLRDSVLEAHR